MTDIRAIIFDFNGVIEAHGTVDEELLKFIRTDLANMQTAVLTAMDSRLLKLTLQRFEPLPFNELFCSDTLDARKPHPESFREAAQRLNVPVEACLMVDDSPSNVKGAQQAGMQAHQYKGFADFVAMLNQRSDGI